MARPSPRGAVRTRTLAPFDGGVPQEAVPRPGRHLAHVVVDRERGPAPRLVGRGPLVGGDDLNQAPRPPEGRRRDAPVVDGPPEGARGHPPQGWGDVVHPLAQAVIDLVPELVPHREVHQRRGEQHDHGHGRGAAERQPGADRHPTPEAAHHSSRSTYPTPRTVWMSRGSPPSSSLRRRLEM